jgi:hypothetical protein
VLGVPFEGLHWLR